MVKQTAAMILTWALALGASACGSVPERPAYQPDTLTAEETGDTVLTAAADSHASQTLYLWEQGNTPAMTEYTENNRNYFDDPDFRPYVVTFPVPEGTLAAFSLKEMQETASHGVWLRYLLRH